MTENSSDMTNKNSRMRKMFPLVFALTERKDI